MVLPLSDDNSDRRSFPWVNYVLIGINVLVFLLFQGAGTNEEFTYTFSTVPGRIVSNSNEEYYLTVTEPGQEARVLIPPTPGTPYLTLLTSMFMHGSIMHIIGNMLFLWIFGDNVEDALGHLRYVGFYLLCGLLASLAHVATTYAFGMDPMTPSLGASGAISGVLGGYILLYPRKRVMVLMFRFVTWVPAWVAIGMWFAFQIIYGVADLGRTGGGVAYGAHVGGFVAGLALVKVFAIGVVLPKDRSVPRSERRPWPT
jgi:membrane associated rhomboid family serine protease